ncbi:MAG: histidinol-phosphatase HisJ family protein [Christensenellales bacterium]|jgi:histidinol-phosphatase (PHP family)
MIPFSSPHVHTTYCDGRSTAREMVEAAVAAGFVSLGFSGHARQGYDPQYAMSVSGEQQYIRDVLALRDEYQGQLRIWLGVELDRFARADRSQYHYILGAAHYIQSGDRYISVDGNIDALDHARNTQYHGDGMALAQEYYDTMAPFIRDYKPDIVAHFDLVRKHNAKLNLFDESDPAYLRMARDAMEVAFEGCTLLEVNTGGMARAGLSEPYPILPLLQTWHEMGGRVTLASDCHLASQIDYGYEKGLELIRQAGFERMTLLGTGDQLFEEVDLTR